MWMNRNKILENLLDKELFESPQKLLSFDGNFFKDEIVDVIRKILSGYDSIGVKVLKKQYCKLSNGDYLDCIKVQSKDGHCRVLWNPKLNLVEYAIFFKIEDTIRKYYDEKIQIKNCLLWKSSNSKFSKNIDFINFGKTQFFEVLEKEGVLTSDDMLTEKGMNFWDRRMRESLKKGYHISVWNTHENSYMRIDTLEEFEKTKSKYFDTHRKFKRFIYSIEKPPIYPDIDLEGATL